MLCVITLTCQSSDSIDPSLTTGFVPRQEYDDLKAKYDALLASSQTTTTRRPRQPRNIVAVESRGEDGRSPDVDASGEGSGGPRKKRSMRLEVGMIMTMSKQEILTLPTM